MEEKEIVQQEPPKLSPSDFAAQLKSKYPQYKDVEDGLLVEKMLAKYPVYRDKIDFSVKKKDLSDGVAPEKEPESTLGTENTLSDTTEPNDRFQELLNNPPIDAYDPDSFISKEFNAIKSDFESRPPMQVDNSDLLERLEKIQPKKNKSPLQFQIDNLEKIDQEIKTSEAKANVIAKATGKKPEEILESDENYRQNKLNFKRAKGNDYAATFAANTMNASAGISGTPSAIVESVGRMFMTDDEYKSIPQEQRDDFFSTVLESMPLSNLQGLGAIAKLGKERQSELLEDAKNLRAITTQYDTAITEDLFVEGDYSQAGRRIAVEGVASIPSLVQAVIPYVGIASMVTGSAANKLDENNKEGENVKDGVTDAWINGFSEGLLELTTKGLARRMGQAIGGVGKEEAKTLAKSLLENLVYAPIKEGSSEASTEIINKLSDAFVLGNEVAIKDSLFEIFDAFLIGGAVGGGIGSVTALAENVKRNKKAIDGDPEARKTIEKELTNEPIEGERVELNIPADPNAEPTEVVTENQETTEEIKEQEVAEPTPDVEEIEEDIKKFKNTNYGEKDRTNLRLLAANEATLSKSEKQEIQRLRSKRDNYIEELEKQLQSISKRYGGKANVESFSRQDRQQWKLLQRELQVVNENRTNREQEKYASGPLQRRDVDNTRIKQNDENKAGYNLVENTQGKNDSGASNKQTKKPQIKNEFNPLSRKEVENKSNSGNRRNELQYTSQKNENGYEFTGSIKNENIEAERKAFIQSDKGKNYLNEKQKNRNTSINEGVQPSTSKREVKRVNPKGVKGEFDVEINEQGAVSKITNTKGREIPKFIERTLKDGTKKLVKNGNYSRVASEAIGVITENQANDEKRAKVSKAIESFEPSNEYEFAVQYLANGGKVKLADAKSQGQGAKGGKWAAGFNKEESLPSIERASEIVFEQSGRQDLDQQEIRNNLEALVREKGSLGEVQDIVLDISSQKAQAVQEQELYEYKNTLSTEELAKFESQVAEDSYLEELSYDEKVEYYEEQFQRPAENVGEPEGSTPSVQERTRKEEAQERKQVAFEKIDDLAQKLKDALPGIKDTDINTNGFTQDQLIDLMAKSVKHLVGTGIELDLAIQQVVASIKEKLNIDVDPENLKSKISPEKSTSKTPPTPPKKPNKKTGEGFKRAKGRKSIINRAVKGGANPKTVAALEELGLTYEVESQEVAQKKAREFVEKVGFKEAVKLIKSGAIEPGAELAFIFGEVIDQLETANNKEFDETYLEIQQDIFNSFDTSAREYGRFISALNKVYNSSNYRYSLAKQTEAWKARNPKELDSDGNIPSDIMQKFKERDAKIKELENQIRETEEALAKAEANRAVQGIDEYNQRQSVRRPSKSSLKKAANALRKAKFTKSINDMANLNSDPTGVIKLVWDGAIETMAKALDAGASVEQAIKKGVSAIKKSDWYKSLNPKNRKAVEEQFENDARDIIEENIEEDLGEVSVDEDGKIKIPSKLIRKLVSDGVKDADALAQRIIDEYLSELYPDAEFTVREVRDAISGYGRTVNPSQDELSLEVSKLKNMARVLSGMEDVQKGQRPQRSGYQRREKTDQERRAEKELKAAMKDLPMDEADIDKQWKSRLDTVKSRLKNRISDLKDQIDKKERSRPERTPIEYDQEAKLLEAEKERLQAVLESIVGKPELTPEQKVLRLENGLERQVEKLQEQIDAGDIAYKTKTQKVTSPKIKKLREEQARLRKELTEMRKEAGLIEKRQLENRKNAVKRRLAELQEKRANKDYSKKERKPLPEDTELAKLKREYAKEKEKYDQEAYQDELRNLSGARKLLHRAISLMGLPRTLMATGEFSFILLQNAVPTINLALKNPKKLWRIIKATYNSYSNRKHDAIQAALEQGENYELAKSLKLGLTRTDFKESAKNEEFQGDFIHGVFKGIGDIVDGSGKKRLTTFDTVLRAMGKDVKDNPKFTLSEQVQNANPFAAMERFTNTYGNLVKMELFDKGAIQLQMQGKNPAENKKDYERLAKAINTLTGRANLMGYETSSPLLNMLFFSARFALSTFNKLNPVWYGIILNDSENGLNFESSKDFVKSLKTYKPSVAQKMAISQTAIYVTTMATVITALQAIGGEDEEGNPRFTIEKDLRSSDFGKLKIGNLRYDFFGGHLPWIVLFSRISTGKIKKTSGNIMDLGEGRSRSGLDLVFDFLKNKANPFIAIPMRMLGSSEKIDGVRYDEFGNEISIEEEVKKIWPIYWQGISEYIKERPEEAQALNDAIMVMGLTGVNSQIYGTSPKSSFKSFASDIKNEVNEKRSQFFTPKKDKVTSDEQLEEEWNKFIKVHQENYAKLQERMEFENKYIGADEVKDALKQRGFNAHITNIYEKGGTIVNLYRYNNIKTRLKNLNDNYKGSKKEGAEEELRIMTEDLLKRQTFFNKKAVEYNREFLKD